MVIDPIYSQTSDDLFDLLILTLPYIKTEGNTWPEASWLIDYPRT